MKIRNGFVSNSSSSSFVCDICGNCESGMDASLAEFEMSCSRYGEFCNHHIEVSRIGAFIRNMYNKIKAGEAVNDKNIVDFIEDTLGDMNIERLTDQELGDNLSEEFIKSYDNELPDEVCPIYNLDCVTNDSIIKYLCLILNTDIDSIRDQIKTKFNNIIEIKNYKKQ